MFSRALPFATFIFFLATSDFFERILSASSIDALWLYVIKIAAVAALIGYFWPKYTELKCIKAQSPELKAKHFFYAFLAGLFVFSLWILPYPAWALLGKDVAAVNPVQGQNTATVVIWLTIRLLGAALIVPIMEELFWRSFLMRWIDNKNFLSVSPEKVSTYALIATSCLFALEHQLWLAGLCAGLVYAWLYRTYRHLWIPIFAHAVTNGLLGAWVLLTGQWQYW